MKPGLCLVLVLSGVVSTAIVSLPAVQQLPPSKPMVLPIPAPSPMKPAPALPVTPAAPATVDAKKTAPTKGRNGGTPGNTADGQSAVAAKPGRPGGTPGLLVGDWIVDVDASAKAAGAGAAPGGVRIKVDGATITFIRETANGEQSRTYPLDGSVTSLVTPGRGASEVQTKAKVVIEGDTLSIQSETAGRQSVVKWFRENNRLIQESRVGEATVRTVYETRGGLAAEGAKAPASDWTGKLRLGVVAIGGETTGIVLETAAGKFELQAANDAIDAEFRKLDGQQVTVTGTLAKRPGVEMKERSIITVAKVTKAKGGM